MKMDLFVMRADGSSRKQITRLGGASFAPFFFPDSKRIIFASNYENSGTSQFELYAISRDGGQPERITYSAGFNSFPMFSPDGKKLVFSSNRNAKQPREINIFIADWVP
jgi:Tol biopolymer transport system component